MVFFLFSSTSNLQIRILCRKNKGGSPEVSIFLLNCIEVSKEKRIFISLILFIIVSLQFSKKFYYSGYREEGIN